MKQAHIALDESLGLRYAILPGDPARPGAHDGDDVGEEDPL